MHLELLERFLNQPDSEDTAQCHIFTDISWQQYEALLEDIGDDFPGLHVTYLEGTLELMSPSRRHESNKSAIGSLLEAYFQENQIRYYPLGSTTFRKKAKSRGAEPDECYCIGTEKEFPDIAIEVVKTSGGINKLEVYQGLEVPEVWFWRNNKFSVYCLRGNHYEQMIRSEFLPNLDLELLASFVLNPEPLDAVLQFREAIRASY
ncbi:MAG: Uma2 family endonuclease [Myxacorys chilensis ATA2-1-KO14]|jgi:Uma2 family endonuclease|nr:Uma2 family endonuclease [Myxacorys chilensis ATA2-1-KO14]